MVCTHLGKAMYVLHPVLQKFSHFCHGNSSSEMPDLVNVCHSLFVVNLLTTWATCTPLAQSGPWNDVCMDRWSCFRGSQEGTSRFPKLEDCAHFHYDFVDFGPIQVRAGFWLMSLIYCVVFVPQEARFFRLCSFTFKLTSRKVDKWGECVGVDKDEWERRRITESFFTTRTAPQRYDLNLFSFFYSSGQSVVENYLSISYNKACRAGLCKVSPTGLTFNHELTSLCLRK